LPFGGFRVHFSSYQEKKRMDATGPRVVLVHDWLTGMRGGEKCLEVLCERWPAAPLYALLHKPGAVSQTIESRPLRTSFLQRLPAVHGYYRYLLPLMPTAVESFRSPPADLIVSLSHCVAKAFRPPEGVPHVSYCFTPMRYAWHQRQAYFGAGRLGRLKSRMADTILARLRSWDRHTAGRVTHFIAISQTVRDRIQDCYGRDSTVIYPPVDTDFYRPAPVPREGFYLIVSALAPYKRLDLAVEACTRLRRRLVVIGAGQVQNRLRALKGPTVRFLGWQSDDVIRDHLRRCRALLFPGVEAFGIGPVEAMACGAPVVAFAQGGATETVVPVQKAYRKRFPGQEPTGWWFEEQSVDCLAEAILEFEKSEPAFSVSASRRQAERFSRERFAEEIFAYLDNVLHPATLPARRAA
jgi:glycosyltransferase involved in cell wall biosynthesis